MRHVDKHLRRSTLLDLLGARERLSVEDAAAELSVSPATIRRDFDELAGQQLLRRTHGGAVSGGLAYELPMRYKTARMAAEKQRIAEVAAGLVEPGAVIGINGGTTATAVASAVALRLASHAGPDGRAVTIVTNALNIACELVVRPEVEVVMAGGAARARSYETVGPLASMILRELSTDIAFLGVGGIDVEAGATAPNEAEAGINRLLAEHAGEVVVVADSSKLGRRAFARIVALEAISTVITDSAATPEQTAGFEAAGVRVLRA